MLSRIADSMFWMNRYVERSEGLLRMLHTSYVLSLDKGSNVNDNWVPLLNIFTTLSSSEKIALSQKPNNIIQHVLLDSQNPNSLKTLLNRARENARGMQDHITKEVWEQVNHLYHLINNPQTEKQLLSSDQLAAIESLLKNCLLYTGITDSTMPRGMGWNFMSMGKHVERCIMTISITAEHFNSLGPNQEKARDILYWRSLLFTLSGYEFHLKNYRSAETDKNVLDQTVFNMLFPHSVMYSLERIKKYQEDIIEQNQPLAKADLMKRFGRLYSFVEFADLDTLEGESLGTFLWSTQAQLASFNQQFSHTFFSYS